MREKVAQQQHHLEEQQTGTPYRNGVAKPRKQHLANHGLDLEQEKGAKRNRGAVQQRQHVLSETPWLWHRWALSVPVGRCTLIVQIRNHF
jgi:hypothetical protein